MLFFQLISRQIDAQFTRQDFYANFCSDLPLGTSSRTDYHDGSQIIGNIPAVWCVKSDLVRSEGCQDHSYYNLQYSTCWTALDYITAFGVFPQGKTKCRHPPTFWFECTWPNTFWPSYCHSQSFHFLEDCLYQTVKYLVARKLFYWT